MHLASFLSDRKAALKIGSSIGEWLLSISGTSAGTVLGPILFIMFVHDLPKGISPKFADDVNGIAIEDDEVSLQSSLQKHADSMSKWSNVNGLSIKSSKTVFMQIGTRSNISIFFEGSAIKEQIKDSFESSHTPKHRHV